MEQPTRTAAYFDTIGVLVPDRPELPAPKAAARLRRMFRSLAPRFTGKLAWHDITHCRQPSPPTLRDRDHWPGTPVGMRLPLGWVAAGVLPILLGRLSELGATTYRLDVALDVDLAAGVQLDLDALGFDLEYRNTHYRGHVTTDDVSGAAYSDRVSKPAGFADGRRVQHVEHRLHGDAIPMAVRRDVFVLAIIDPLDLWQSCAHKTPVEPVSETLRRVLGALRSRSDSGRVTIADKELGALAECPESTAGWAIPALYRMGFLLDVHRQRGRGNRSRYRLADSTSLWYPSPAAASAS